MAFDRSAVKAPYLKVTRQGKTSYMKVSEMSDGEILSALARPDNAGALAAGWQLSNGQVMKTPTFVQQTRPQEPAPVRPVTQQNPTPPVGGGTGVASVGGGAGVGGAGVTTVGPGGLNPTNPIDGASTQQIAHAKLGVQNAVAPINRQIAELQANGMGQYVSRLGVLNRDARIAKHDYNAQSAGAGFRRSGGVNTNARNVNAQASAGERDLYNTVGQGKVNSLTSEKKDLVQQTVLGILGGLTGQVDYTQWGN